MLPEVNAIQKIHNLNLATGGVSIPTYPISSATCLYISVLDNESLQTQNFGQKQRFFFFSHLIRKAGRWRLPSCGLHVCLLLSLGCGVLTPGLYSLPESQQCQCFEISFDFPPGTNFYPNSFQNINFTSEQLTIVQNLSHMALNSSKKSLPSGNSLIRRGGFRYTSPRGHW